MDSPRMFDVDAARIAWLIEVLDARVVSLAYVSWPGAGADHQSTCTGSERAASWDLAPVADLAVYTAL
jgi:hypothetical protein